jgi:AraC family transcriptional regulator of arabinose operon
MHDPTVGLHNPAGAKKEEPFVRLTTSTPPDGALIAGHLTPCYAREVLRVNGTRDWLLTLTLKGAAFYKQENVYFEARAGDAVLIEPGAYQNYAPLGGSGWDCLWVHFVARPAWLSHLAWPSAGKGIYRFKLADVAVRKAVATSLRRCIDHAAREYRGLSQELAMNALEEAILLISGARNEAEESRRLSPPIRRVLDCLCQAPEQRHSVPDLAKLAQLSPSRLMHRFKVETGDSIIAYLLKLRLRQAAKLLALPDLSVKEVAHQSGFSSQYYFSRQFRSHYALSPLRYRQKQMQKSKRHVRAL